MSMTIISVIKMEVTGKLRNLQLPTFSGQIHEWLLNKDLFIASVQNNGNLSQVQNLQNFKLSCKSGCAYRLSIPTDDSNYKIAWDLLP